MGGEGRDGSLASSDQGWRCVPSLQADSRATQITSATASHNAASMEPILDRPPWGSHSQISPLRSASLSTSFFISVCVPEASVISRSFLDLLSGSALSCLFESPYMLNTSGSLNLSLLGALPLPPSTTLSSFLYRRASLAPHFHLFLCICSRLCLSVFHLISLPFAILSQSSGTHKGVHSRCRLSFPPLTYGGQEVEAPSLCASPTLPPNPKTACYCGTNSHSRLHLIRLICCPRAGQSWRKPQAQAPNAKEMYPHSTGPGLVPQTGS